MAEVPEVSIVMATRDRSAMLADALAALRAQRDCDVEIIVLDDGSVDETPALLAAAVRGDPDRLRTARVAASGGPAVARNIGWRLARAPWVAFTDDDCEADAGWAAALLAAAGRTGADIVQGRTEPNPAHPDACWRRTVEVRGFSHRYQTCNLAVRRAVLEAVGGFDESFRFAGEDADLGWRARRAGFRAVYAADALVLHAIRPHSYAEHLRSRRTWAELVQFYGRHPESRPALLVGRLFHRRAHATIVCGTIVGIGAGAVLSWWIPVVLPVVYVANSARKPWHGHRSYRRRLRCAALGSVASAWEVVQFLRSSIRYRTLVL